ncbi:MAG TPA: glycosyl hydrolase, partial [Gemmatimonadaceae bacterium]|nr:glycosyl hydrolase [Gemmatimonadaceae bacterium]
MRHFSSFRTGFVILALIGGAIPAMAQQQGARAGARPRPKPIDPFRFEMMGPATGGRIAAVVGVPGDPKTWYVGNASGGVWKSSDSGSTFRPVFDSMRVQAIGALAVSPSNPQEVWAGTGEAWAIRDADVMGDGIYLSPDSGATWTNMGLKETGRIGRIIVHPTNPKIVYACALGRVTGPQQERGVFRTTDGGATWQRVLFVDPNTGCSGLSMDAHDPNVLIAGMWQVAMHTWGMFSGGPSSGMYISHDGGSTWTPVRDAGLPKAPVGKIDVAIAPSDPQRMYALIQTANQGSLWRSDDAGRTWRVTNWDRALIGRAGYYIRLAVSPKNADEILVANSSFFRSTDGGKTFLIERWGGDTHDIWYDPT